MGGVLEKLGQGKMIMLSGQVGTLITYNVYKESSPYLGGEHWTGILFCSTEVYQFSHVEHKLGKIAQYCILPVVDAIQDVTT
jgi:hypothetical protein